MLAIWLKTIFSFRSYHELRRASGWRVAFFALYLLLVGVLISTGYLFWQIHTKLPVFIQQFPSVTFEKGRLISSTQHTLAFPATNFVLLLDTAPQAAVPSVEEFKTRQILAYVHGNQLFVPSVTGVNAQTLPPQLNGTFDAQTLQQYAPTLRNFLQSMAFISSFFLVGGFFLFSYIMAWAVCFFWRAWRRLSLPLGSVSRWALFLQGPALILFTIHLLVSIPLFFFAMFVLFNIYVQQICNTLSEPRGPHAA